MSAIAQPLNGRFGESRASVLVVDDTPANLLAFEAVLAPLGHRIVQASSGEEALRCLLHEDFCVVLLDVQMAGMDGFETASLIKAHPRTAQTPIIFVTAINRDEAHIFKGYDHGGVDYLLKPFDPHILRSKVGVFVDLYVRSKKTEQQEKFLHEEVRARLEQRGEDRYYGLAESIPIAIWTTDAEGSVKYCNRAWTNYSGVHAEQVVTLVDPSFVHPSDLDGLCAGWNLASHEGVAWEVEVRLRRRDGIYRWHIVRGLPQANAEARVTGWIVTATDIDQHKLAEELRAQLLERETSARESAEAANKAKDDFLAVISHELRAPLNAIVGWIEILRGKQLNVDETDHALETIARNAEMQRVLVEDILDVSSIVTGRLTIDPTSINLTCLVRDEVESFRPLAATKGVSLDMTLGADEQEVLVDRRRMQQVVSNLLGNAIKFTPQGGRVEVWTEKSGATFVIRIKDTGEGIVKELLPEVFDRFRQGDSSITRAQPGVGLGLAIVRHMVVLHGGEVLAESEGAGFGSTFTVSIPVQASAASPEAREPEVADEAQPRMGGGLDDVRVLVVDDDEDSRDLLERYLTSRGAQVVGASSVEQALVRLQEAHPHILISDLGMPGEDGFALIHRIRRLPAESGGTIPAIALTGFASNQHRTAALAAGFQAHVAKPVDLERLVRLITASLLTPAAAE